MGCSGKPFVLTIQPSGDRGSVSGWLESTPTLSFEDRLPRFDPTPAETDLALWWSIGSIGGEGGQSIAYFYGQNAVTQVAVAEGARDFDQIDRGALVFNDWETRQVFPGEIVVFLHLMTGEMLALRLDAVYDADSRGDPDGLCAGIDASWTFTF
jgi:hypothetical protein